jgi:hypothetical protein
MGDNLQLGFDADRRSGTAPPEKQEERGSCSGCIWESSRVEQGPGQGREWYRQKGYRQGPEQKLVGIGTECSM